MKLAFVVPRYGVEIHGGAELAARLLGEHLAAASPWTVEVLTTRARDARTWADEYGAGTSEINGVRVHRFSATGRDPSFRDVSKLLLRQPARAPRADAERWIDLQGPVSAELLDAVAGSDADVVAFYPYLYHPTVRGLPLVGRRGVLHAAAHDEPPLHLPTFPPVFRAAAGLVYHTLSERRLVEDTFAVGPRRQVVLGLGVEDEVAGGGAPVDGPYLLYVGRVDDGKGTNMLRDYFAAYKQRRPGPLKLVLAGPRLDVPAEHPDVVLTGEVDEATKWALHRGARLFVNPSSYESFSIVLMEAWSTGRPVVVNGRSDVLREHCRRSGGGVWFDRYATFEAVLDRLLADDDLAERLGRRGQDYVAANYRWPSVVRRYQQFIEAVAAHA